MSPQLIAQEGGVMRPWPLHYSSSSFQVWHLLLPEKRGGTEKAAPPPLWLTWEFFRGKPERGNSDCRASLKWDGHVLCESHTRVCVCKMKGPFFCWINGVDLKGLGNPAWGQPSFRFLVSGRWCHLRLRGSHEWWSRWQIEHGSRTRARKMAFPLTPDECRCLPSPESRRDFQASSIHQLLATQLFAQG